MFCLGNATHYLLELTGAVLRRCSLKKVFLEISEKSQENTCARVSFLIKLQAYRPLQNTFFTEHLRMTASGLRNAK